MTKAWKINKDPLFRGDVAHGVRSATHGADRSIVRHILYLDGQGRDTPYLSCTESKETATRFANKGGKVYETYAKEWLSSGVKHRSRKELFLLLKGGGKGDAKWHDAFEVAIARKYVEEHMEHLCDFTDKATQADIDVAVGKIFL
ncbi:hypothetical protein [Variovorax paradoxus]|uniref:hypothetical protein n=1 Tax=Variovorax paradoxus TaxID=34073 RepID=UPI0012DA5E54|nr:hypothetical protein [Variovorax paradoxus]